MFNKINRSLMVNIVLIMLTTIVVFSSVALSQPTADSISVASATGENGQTIQVPVNITNVANGPLQVIMFDVNYMHSVVDIVAVTNGDLLPLDSITQQPKWAASLGGNHESVTLSTSAQATALQNGSTGTIAVLWVSVIGTVGQQTDMNLTNIDVSSTGLEHGMIPSINGTFMVTGDIPTIGDIVINEFVSDNATEWVELYNNDTGPVNLTDWTLEDGAGTTKSLSGIIPADACIVFGPYTNWLNNGGDIIYLNDTTANIDKVAYGSWDDGNTADNTLAPGKNKSAGRYPNGVDTDVDVDDFQIFDNPTPGAGNVVVTTADTTPPYTSEHDPASGATGVSIDTNITVHVLDDGAGVNMSTIVMAVNGAVVTPDITGTSADYTIVCDPSADFSYDQLVNVTIDAADLNETPNAMATDAYSFTTESAPATYPTAASIGVESAKGNSSQTIQVPVNITNVANGPLQVIMFDVNYTHSVIDIVAVTNGDLLPLNSVTQQPEWTASLGGNHESVTLSTSAQVTALQNGSTGTIAVLWVSVIGTVGQQTDMNLTNIDVSSTGLEHGTIPSINGTFRVAGGPGAADTTPPNTAGHDPAQDATGISIDTSITVHVLDAVSGVNNSTIVMTVNGTVVTPDITGTTADYTIVYTPPDDFSYDQLVNVTINASDLNETPNVMATDAYSFTTAGAPTYGVTISQPDDQTTYEGVNATYLLTVTNTGNVNDTYNLAVTNIDGATTAAMNMTTIALDAGDSGVVALDVTNTTARTFNVTVNATSQTDADANYTTSCIVTTVEVKPVDDDDGNDGNGGNGGGSGTYPPRWGEPAPTSAATPAPTAAPEPTVAPTEAPTVAPTEAPTKAPTVAPTETTTTKMKTEGTPGFGAVLTVFAIAGLLVAAYLVMRRRE